MLYVILSQSVPTNLRRSTRKRRLSAHLEDYTDSSGSEDEDLMVRIYTLASPKLLYSCYNNFFSTCMGLSLGW